jgi:hypothetical protein
VTGPGASSDAKAEAPNPIMIMTGTTKKNLTKALWTDIIII